MKPFYERRPEDLYSFDTVVQDFPAHIHINLEMFYLANGSMEITANHKTFQMKPGDLAIIFPNCIHSRTTPDRTSIQVIITGVTPTLTGYFSNTIMNCLPESPVIPAEEIPKEIKSALFQLMRLSFNVNRDKYAELLIQSYMQIILGLALPKLRLVPVKNTGYKTVQKTINYILDNFSAPISLESAAEFVGVGKNHLSAVFSRQMQVGFHQYLQDARLNASKRLLQTTEKSVTDIAYECGFGSLRTFNRVFSQVLGQTPTEYRRSAEPPQ